MQELVNEIYVQKQGNLELAEANAIDRQQMKNGMITAWDEIQDNVFATQLQVRTEMQARYNDTVSILQTTREDLFRAIHAKEEISEKKLEEQDKLVNSLKETIEEQRFFLKLILGREEAENLKTRNFEKRIFELTQENQIANNINTVIQTSTSSSSGNNVFTIDESVVNRLITSLTDKLAAPLITKDKTVRTIEEVTQETLSKKKEIKERNYNQFEKFQRMGESRMMSRIPNPGGPGGNPDPKKISYGGEPSDDENNSKNSQKNP